MTLAALIQLLPVLLAAIAPILAQLASAQRAGDAARAAELVQQLEQAYSLALQAGRLVATCQKEGREPTSDECAPFDAAWQGAEAQLKKDLDA